MYDYREYHFKKIELAIEVLRETVIILFTGILFFQSWIGCVLLLPTLYWRIERRRERKKQQRLEELRMDFKEVILSMAASLHAGYSLEESIGLALEDLERLYPEERRPMMEELMWMMRNMEIRISVEQLFEELAYRSDLEEIKSYAVILSTVRRQGGNLVQISRQTAEHISEKIQVQMEIEQVIAGKKLEKKIMFFMPYFILVYLQLTNGTYLTPLFHNLYGGCCMAICLMTVYGADWWAERVIRIEV
ncbi:MAG: type II secretion system F family protein [Lachnospiraceae bacterium]|nr:type II secretion system F family protein [Lachnospiraceae bacterium]